MDEYEDYASYKKEHKDILDKLDACNSSINMCLKDVVSVLDYIYKKHDEGSKIDDDLAEIFEVGYGYFSGVMQDLSVYYKDYFNFNMDVMNGYSNLIVAEIMLEDIASFLDVEEYLTDERKQTFNDLEQEIDDILVNRKPYDREFVNDIQQKIEELLPLNVNYRPVYDVFSLIAEELNVY